MPGTLLGGTSIGPWPETEPLLLGEGTTRPSNPVTSSLAATPLRRPSSPRPKPPELPSDVLLHISRFIVFDEGSLRPTDSQTILACSLVCRDWRDSFEPLLYRSSVVPHSQLRKYISALRGPRRWGSSLRELIITDVPLDFDLKRLQRHIDELFQVIAGRDADDADCLAPNIRLVLVLAGPMTHAMASELRLKPFAQLKVISCGARSSVNRRFLRLPIRLAKVVGEDFRRTIKARSLLLSACETFCLAFFFSFSALGTYLALLLFLAEEPEGLDDSFNIYLSFLAATMSAACYWKLGDLHGPIATTRNELEA